MRDPGCSVHLQIKLGPTSLDSAFQTLDGLSYVVLLAACPFTCLVDAVQPFCGMDKSNLGSFTVRHACRRASQVDLRRIR